MPGARGDRGRGRGEPGQRPGATSRRVDHRVHFDMLEKGARDLEKPLSAGDFASQLAPLDALVTGFEALRLPNVAALEEKLRGRVFTALLRVGRQVTVSPDEAKERARRDVHVRLA